MTDNQKYVAIFKNINGTYDYLSVNGRWYPITSIIANPIALIVAEPVKQSNNQVEESEFLDINMCITADEFEVVKVMEPEEIAAFDPTRHKF